MAVCVNGLVAYPPTGHAEADTRGKGWPRRKAAELAERVGLRTPVHTYIDVTDAGENLVCKLGLRTVPTHALVDSSGQLVSVLARGQLPNGQAVEALVGNPPPLAGLCIPCTPCASARLRQCRTNAWLDPTDLGAPLPMAPYF